MLAGLWRSLASTIRCRPLMSSLHQRAKDLFLQALARPAEDRAAFVADARAQDGSRRHGVEPLAHRAPPHEVESLLACHAEDSNKPEASSADPPFAPGEVIAARYRMIARIGR